MALRGWLIYGGSVALHAGIAIGAGAFGARTIVESYAVAFTESEQKPEPPKPVEQKIEPKQDEAKAPRRPRAAPAAKTEPEVAKPATPPPGQQAAADDTPDYGLALSNTGEGGGGFTVPTGGGGGGRRPSAAPAPVKKVLAPAAQAAPADDCAEPLQKAKPLSVPQPAYTAAAREAGVEGKVRVQITLSATGTVTAVSLIAGLGHGLDEAALAAARRASFEPARRCGKPTPSTFVIAMRFQL